MSAPTQPAAAAVAPYFEDLEVGQLVAEAPALTLTPGHAATHQAILGDRLRLALDAELSRRVIGGEAPLAHPGLVCDVAIGQSTLLTQRVIGNLFYRGLALRRAPLIGDTLRTTTEVVALRQNSPKPDRPATGLAVLRVLTRDQEERPVLDFRRCAMLPLRDPRGETGRADEIAADGTAADVAVLAASVAGWDLDAYREAVPGPHFADLEPGQTWTLAGGDVVSDAPSLARLTLNLAMAHHDCEAGQRGRRLVYGGHTIGLAGSQLNRALPALVTIVGWHSCDHLGPVFEGDTLHSRVELERTEPLPGGGGIVHLRSRVRAHRGGEPAKVLDWRLAAVMA
ncbi:MAG TPA: MaoC family dehydratase [Solirubrobacterales bacterium]|nr:MaoC family dehydratase [Solirubrobacterales bacterium]